MMIDKYNKSYFTSFNIIMRFLYNKEKKFTVIGYDKNSNDIEYILNMLPVRFKIERSGNVITLSYIEKDKL